jgi:hypothetical protein
VSTKEEGNWGDDGGLTGLEWNGWNELFRWRANRIKGWESELTKGNGVLLEGKMLNYFTTFLNG